MTASERIREKRRERELAREALGDPANVVRLFPSLYVQVIAGVHDDDSTAGTPDHNRKV